MKVSKQTIVRMIVLFVLLINQLLAAFGKSPLPFDEEQVNTGVSTILTALAALWAWWKNNSFTKEAIKADLYMRAQREQRKKE